MHVDRYFKQDSAAEITARDTLIKGYNKLKLNTTAGVPLDDEEDPEAAAAGEMTLDKVRVVSRAGDQTSRPLFFRLPTTIRHTVSGGELPLHQTRWKCSILMESVAQWPSSDRYKIVCVDNSSRRLERLVFDISIRFSISRATTTAKVCLR